MAELQRHVGRFDLEDPTSRLFGLMERRQFIPGGRYLYATGRDLHQVNNCILLRCPDDREGWATTSYQAEMALMTGAGIGVYYGDVRPSGSVISRTGGIASGPVPKMQQVNETGRHTMQGGNRRSAIWAGLPWWHKDVFDFIQIKDWPDEIRALKDKNWSFPAPMDMTNISVTLDDAFFTAYNAEPLYEEIIYGDGPEQRAPDGTTWSEWAHRVYDTAVAHMVRHGEPGFSVDTGAKADEVLRNACTEITSADDSDVCNLGSLVMPRFSTPNQFGAAVRDAVLFLTAGSVYSDVPYEKVAEIREKNRRLGLGLIGVHEFTMIHGARYGTPESFEILEPYMKEYARALEYANDWQTRLGLSLSKGATALAPNGTIGIVAESTPSADPLFAAAEQREVKVARPTGDSFETHIVVDPTAKRMLESGVKPELIEDAYSLSSTPERRIAMQAFLQDYTDHAISSTINLPAPITTSHHIKQFGRDLMKYLPRLRGVTVYPDGARAGQPRTAVDLEWAISNEGVVYETDEATCAGGVCGI
jgi:ribonucleoside-diphosphate reductase alpha chain